MSCCSPSLRVRAGGFREDGRRTSGLSLSWRAYAEVGYDRQMTRTRCKHR